MLDQKAITFLKVAELGSLSKAAKALYLSSVSVMKQMNAFEAQVGTALFVRTHAGVELTAAGELLYRDLLDIQASCTAALRRARDAAESGKIAIRVGASALRPCRPLTDRWARRGAGQPFRVEIVPFSDDRASLEEVVGNLGRGIDCFVGPCDAPNLLGDCSIRVLGAYECRVGVPDGHRLAGCGRLTWDDLDGEQLMLLARGESQAIDSMRDEIDRCHPGVQVLDAPFLYDEQAFNACAREGFLMETLDAWEGIHPSIATVPMEWNYTVPFGVVYAQEPTEAVTRFVELLGA